jgi:hypothetical protein
MPKTKTTAPEQSREKGQRSIQLPDFLVRNIPTWRHPEWVDANSWRYAVRNQPVATVCKTTLIEQMVSLDWKIEPRDSNKRDELKESIDYYTDFFEWTGKYDYIELLERELEDVLDTPFGAGWELGWENDVSAKDNPNSKLMWVEPLDSATLFPTLNDEFPVGQYVQESLSRPIYFPSRAINRIYMSPRNEMLRWGWGCAPPEKIYLALALLDRGDRYYANLLLDSPEVGILDLGDIAEDSAKSWVKSWKDMLTGIDPFKIPVLYGHEKPATFISFTKNPNELVFNQTITKYASLVCAGYGMSISDIGISATSTGGETLSGTIRQERRTRRTGFAQLKKKDVLFRNRMLPKDLRFMYIDPDEELAVALGRARLATATAMNALSTAKMVTPEEARQQLIADNMFTISMPEQIPESQVWKDQEAKQKEMFDQQAKIAATKKPPERPGMLGKPVAPSGGGHGEVKKSELLDELLDKVPEFREVFEYADEHWDEFDLAKQDSIISKIDEMLKIPA